MWSFVVVVIAPLADYLPCIVKRLEPVLIQAAVSQPGIEAFDERVLGRFSGLDEVEFDASLL